MKGEVEEKEEVEEDEEQEEITTGMPSSETMQQSCTRGSRHFSSVKEWGKEEEEEIKWRKRTRRGSRRRTRSEH